MYYKVNRAIVNITIGLSTAERINADSKGLWYNSIYETDLLNSSETPGMGIQKFYFQRLRFHS
jgi:hypothetical protein